MTTVGENVKKKEPCQCWWDSKDAAPMENSVELLYDPAILPLGIYSKEMKSVFLRDICTHPYVQCSVIHNSQDMKPIYVCQPRNEFFLSVVYVFGIHM